MPGFGIRGSGLGIRDSGFEGSAHGRHLHQLRESGSGDRANDRRRLRRARTQRVVGPYDSARPGLRRGDSGSTQCRQVRDRAVVRELDTLKLGQDRGERGGLPKPPVAGPDRGRASPDRVQTDSGSTPHWVDRRHRSSRIRRPDHRRSNDCSHNRTRLPRCHRPRGIGHRSSEERSRYPRARQRGLWRRSWSSPQ